MPKSTDKSQKSAGKPSGGKGEQSMLKEVLSWVEVIVIAVALAFFIDNVIIINATVPSGSMEKTIMTHSRVLGTRFAYWKSSPKRGDIVVFRYPIDDALGKNTHYIKRIIGLPGEKVEKSLVILNDSRRPREIEWVWKAGGTKKSGKVTVQPGGRADIPIAFAASADTTTIAAGFRCAATGWKSSDKFSLNLLPAKAKAKVSSKVFLFDPEGTAAPVLAAIGVRIVDASATRPGKGDILVVGRNAFQKLPFSFAETVGSGVKVVVLEQDAATLKKMGFRLQEHGLRNLFAATGDFAGLDMTDWRTAASCRRFFPRSPPRATSCRSSMAASISSTLR